VVRGQYGVVSGVFFVYGVDGREGEGEGEGGGGAEGERFVPLIRGWRLKVCEGWMVLYTLRGGAIVGALDFGVGCKIFIFAPYSAHMEGGGHRGDHSFANQ
jgi:hypothetical protein